MDVKWGIGIAVGFLSFFWQIWRYLAKEDIKIIINNKKTEMHKITREGDLPSNIRGKIKRVEIIIHNRLKDVINYIGEEVIKPKNLFFLIPHAKNGIGKIMEYKRLRSFGGNNLSGGFPILPGDRYIVNISLLLYEGEKPTIATKIKFKFYQEDKKINKIKKRKLNFKNEQPFF